MNREPTTETTELPRSPVEKAPILTLEERFSQSIQRISVKGTQWIRRRTNLTFIPGKTFPNPLSNVPQTSNEHFLHDFLKNVVAFQC